MLISFLITTIIIFTTLIFLAPSPLPLGAIILLLALSAAITTSHLASSWFGFIMFLIYIGGLLVIFIYFAALTPNKLISFNHVALTLTIILLPTLFLLIFFFLSFTPLRITNPPLLHLSTLYSTPNIPVLLSIALILFLILIAVVKISTQSSGPLRPFK